MPGRALRLTAAALGAGGHVEQTLPRNICSSAKAEDVIFRRVVKIDDVAVRKHLGKFSERVGAIAMALVINIEEGKEAVPSNTHRQVQCDNNEPEHGDGDLDSGNNLNGGKDCLEGELLEYKN